MADNSKIEWTDATWNIITGCSVVSPGCTNCFAQRLAGTRLRNHPSRAGLTKESKAGPVWTGDVRFNPEWLDQPTRWTRPRRIFVCAHGDLFHHAVSDEWLDAIFDVMERCPQHTFQILTKRAERMHQYILRVRGGKPVLPNVHLGVSVEDQTRADERLPYLVMTPAEVRFISYEPALGPLDLRKIPMQAVVPNLFMRHRYDVLRAGIWTDQGFGFVNHRDMTDHRIHQVIFGGESGPNARPAHPDWAKYMRDECEAAGVAFFFKQWGEWHPHGQQLADGGGNCLGNPDNIWSRWHTFSDEASSWRVGKVRAGALLDGREHKQHAEDGAMLQRERLAKQRPA